MTMTDQDEADEMSC